MRDDEYDEDGVLITEAPKIYEVGGHLPDLRLRTEGFLNKHNDQYPSKPLNIVLFDDALKHVLRIARCLGMNKGCILLVGIGGSGKQSLTRIATYCMSYSTFQVKLATHSRAD